MKRTTPLKMRQKKEEKFKTAEDNLRQALERIKPFVKRTEVVKESQEEQWHFMS